MNTHRQKCSAAACGIAALLMIAATSDAQAQSGLCSSHQRTLFSCAVRDKQVAICASDNLSKTAGNVQYRFGRPSRVELAYPSNGSDWRAVSRAGTLAFSGGGGAVLAFENRPYTYSVYTAVGRGWGSKSGVLVEKSGRRLANLKCTTQPTSELGPDLFSKAGIRPLRGHFDLP